MGWQEETTSPRVPQSSPAIFRGSDHKAGRRGPSSGHVSAGEGKEGPEHPSRPYSPSSCCTVWVSIWCHFLYGPALYSPAADALRPCQHSAFPLLLFPLIPELWWLSLLGGHPSGLCLNLGYRNPERPCCCGQGWLCRPWLLWTCSQSSWEVRTGLCVHLVPYSSPDSLPLATPGPSKTPCRNKHIKTHLPSHTGYTFSLFLFKNAKDYYNSELYFF